MKSFLVTFMLISTAIFTLNSAFDVSGLNTYDQVAELTRRQTPEDLLVWENLFDQRAWIKRRIEDSSRCPDLLVLGSSTMGAFSQDLLEGVSVLNGWLTGPSLEDFEGVTSVLEKTRCFPKAILVGLDPWLFNAKVKDDRWLSLVGEYLEYRGLPHFPYAFYFSAKKKWAEFKERFNYLTTRESLRKFFRRKEASGPEASPLLVRSGPEAYCKSIEVEHYIRSFDGHFTSCPQFYGSDAQVRGVASSYLSQNTHQMADWEEVDRGRSDRLGDLVSRWRAGGSRVILVAPPYHPEAFRVLDADKRVHENFSKLDARLVELAEKSESRYLNFRDPASIGCESSEFSDGHHFRRGCFAKLARKISALIEDRERIRGQ